MSKFFLVLVAKTILTTSHGAEEVFYQMSTKLP